MKLNNTPYPSAIRLFVISVITIFVAETIVMFLMPFFAEDISVVEQALIDASLLVALIIPILYLFMYRPMITHILHSCMSRDAICAKPRSSAGPSVGSVKFTRSGSRKTGPRFEHRSRAVNPHVVRPDSCFF